MFLWVKFWCVTAMTLGRIVAAGSIVSLLFLGAAEYAVIVFGLAAVLDFDGYFARKWEVTTGFGKVLDPLSDKILILSVVGALLHTGVLWSYWFTIPAGIIVAREAIMLIGTVIKLGFRFRELRVAELRDFFEFGKSQDSVRPDVTNISKKKMGWQCVALFILIGVQATVGIDNNFVFWAGKALWIMGLISFWVAGHYTLVTGLDYLRKEFPSLNPRIDPLLLRLGLRQ